MDGTAWLKAHPEQAAPLDVKYGGTSPDVAKKSAEKMVPLLSDTGEISPVGLQQALDNQAEITQTKITLTPDQLVDYGPLHEALGKS